MKYLQRPAVQEINTSLVVRTGSDFKKFDKVWKKVVAEDKERGHSSNFAALSILRNIILGKDLYHGFTPKMRPNCLKNGRNFIGGFQAAYRELYYCLERSSPSLLQVDVHRLMLSFSYACPTTFKKALPNPLDFDALWYNDSYLGRVQKMITELQSEDVDLRGKSINDLFDLFEKDHMYNFYRKEDYISKKLGYEDFQAMLRKFASKWLAVHDKNEHLESVTLTEDPMWLYIDSDGNDHRIQKELCSKIVITTRTKYHGGESIKTPYYVPVTHLWEIEWLKDIKK